MVSTFTRPPLAPSALAAPVPLPFLPFPLLESGVVISFNSSNCLTPLFSFSTFLAAFPVLSAISSALSAASDQSSAIPLFVTSNFQPKIAPKAFVTVSAKLITCVIAKFNPLKNGLNALINDVPIIPASS